MKNETINDVAESDHRIQPRLTEGGCAAALAVVMAVKDSGLDYGLWKPLMDNINGLESALAAFGFESHEYVAAAIILRAWSEDRIPQKRDFLI